MPWQRARKTTKFLKKTYQLQNKGVKYACGNAHFKVVTQRYVK